VSCDGERPPIECQNDCRRNRLGKKCSSYNFNGLFAHAKNLCKTSAEKLVCGAKNITSSVYDCTFAVGCVY